MYNLDSGAINLLKEVFLFESLSPSSDWSFINRLIVKLHDTNDARSFNDWRKIDRLPHAHSAINIVIPMNQHVRKYSKTKKSEIEYDLRYFKTRTVFKYENTMGDNYPSIELKDKQIMYKDQFLLKCGLEQFDYELVAKYIESVIPATPRYDNELVRFLVTNIITAIYEPDKLCEMGKFDQIRLYHKNIIYYALSSLAYSAKILENLLAIEGVTQIREQKNEYVTTPQKLTNCPPVSPL